jgi:flagellar basal body-associated protein FliL
MNDEVPAATVADPVTFVAPAPAPAPPVAEQKPVKKEKVISKPVSEPRPAAPVTEKNKKSSKLVLIILLGVLGLGALGAGGWFAYNKFIAKDTTEVAVATPESEQEVATPAEQPEEVIPEQEAPAETPAEEPVKPAEPAKKTEKTKKTTPKKQTEPQKQQVVQEELVKKDEGVKVVMKNTASAKSPVTLFSSFNTNEVKSGPVFAQKVKFDKPTIVTRITTFHHNDGQGAVAGTISLEGKKKESGGPWQARNAYGSDGTVNGKWICEPNARMEPGTYKVVVSDEKSWSYNTQSGRKGFVIIEGYETD